MKTFFVVALLVAAVAGQSLDILKFNKDTKSMLKFDRPVYPMVHDYENNHVDNFYNYKPVGDFEYDTTTVYQLDEIMSHPLFREYMSLPIFRQYWEYPMFQRYVASIHFQKFWQIPTFRQYFVQPTLFYKYVYPIVTLFKYESTSMNTYTNGNWMRNAYNAYPYNTYNTESNNYYYGQQHDLVNYMPTVCHYNTVYCQALLQKFYNHFQTMMTYGQQEEMQMPYQTNTDMYNPYVARMFQGYYNRYPTYQTEQMTPYTFNNENMYNNVHFNKENMYNNVHFNKDNMYNNVHFNKDMMMNTFETPKMVDDFVRYETTRPIVHNMMGVQTFDKKFFPERIIKA